MSAIAPQRTGPPELPGAISAPVAARIYGGHSVDPSLILIGEETIPKAPGTVTHEQQRNLAAIDAENLYWALYRGIPGITFDSLLRMMLAQWADGHRRCWDLSPEVADALDTLIRQIDR